MLNWFKKNKTEENITAAPEVSTGEITSVLAEQEAKIVKTDDTQIATAISSNNTPVTVEEIEVPATSEEHVPSITYKEIKALKRSRYEKDFMNNPKCTKAYILMNKRTGQIAEIRAFSSFHACNIIGWKANKVVLLGEKDLTVAPETSTQPETSTLSN